MIIRSEQNEQMYREWRWQRWALPLLCQYIWKKPFPRRLCLCPAADIRAVLLFLWFGLERWRAVALKQLLWEAQGQRLKPGDLSALLYTPVAMEQGKLCGVHTQFPLFSSPSPLNTSNVYQFVLDKNSAMIFTFKVYCMDVWVSISAIECIAHSLFQLRLFRKYVFHNFFP